MVATSINVYVGVSSFNFPQHASSAPFAAPSAVMRGNFLASATDLMGMFCCSILSTEHAIDKLNSQSGNLQMAMSKSDAHRSVSPRSQRVRSLASDIVLQRDATSGPLGSMRPIPPPPSSRRPGASPQSRGMDPLSRGMALPETDSRSRCIETRGKLESGAVHVPYIASSCIFDRVEAHFTPFADVSTAAFGASSEYWGHFPDVGIGASGGLARVGVAGFASPDRGSKVLGSMPNLQKLSLAGSARDKGAVQSARDALMGKVSPVPLQHSVCSVSNFIAAFACAHGIADGKCASNLPGCFLF